MEPLRESDPESQPESSEVVGDILRQAMAGLRDTTDGHDLFLNNLDPGQAAPRDPDRARAVRRVPGAIPGGDRDGVLVLNDGHSPAIVLPLHAPSRSRSPQSPVMYSQLKFTPAGITALVLGLIVGVVSLSSLSGQMEPSSPVLDPVYAEASARWCVVIASERIDAFQREFDHLPNQLSELGYPGSEVVGYERVSESRYRLTAPSPSGPVTYDSMRSRSNFMGNSLQTLQAAKAGAP